MKKNNLDSQIESILTELNTISHFSLCIAKRIHYVYTIDLYKSRFQDIYDFGNYLDLSRKTVNSYLNVIERFFDYDIKDFDSSIYKTEYYKIHNNVKNFSFSQLKSILGLSDNEIEQLEITNNLTCKEIEKRKKDLKTHINSLPFSDCSGVPPDQSENKEKTFNSLNDTLKKINPFELGYIPDNSEYVCIFDGKNSMVKGYKAKRNINTAWKHVHQEIENNTDDNICYAVVKIVRR